MNVLRTIALSSSLDTGYANKSLIELRFSVEMQLRDGSDGTASSNLTDEWLSWKF
ncbi:hypothetical protein D3C83_273500 [compost metagenome]